MDILTSVTSTKVIESLEKIFCTYGLPQSLKTDNGTQFVSDEFERFLKTNDIEIALRPRYDLRQMGRLKDKTEACLKPLGLLKLKRRICGPRCESS